MVIYSVFCSLFTIYHAKKEYKQHQKNYKFVICCKQKNHSTMPFSIPHGKKLDHTLARKNDSPTWCGVIVVVWCYCGGVVLLWWCGVTVVVWCYCGSVFVVV